MQIHFIASFSVIAPDPAVEQRLFVGALGLPLHGPEGDDDDYVFSDDLDGARHFGVWPLADAATACFGAPEWPAQHPVPQASVEYDVDDVAAAAAELEAAGYSLLHAAKTEPWGQEIARLQAPSGVLVGVSFTPWMRGAS